MNIPNNINKILLKSLSINSDNIRPRYLKLQSEQKSRTKEKAEVFTPISIVKKMNEDFDSNLSCSDIDYIKRVCLEVTCGEAPFLTSRYDASTGEDIPIHNRVGLLDKKLQRISSTSITEWSELALSALKSTYGYEWQEDSIYIARKNLLFTTIEHFMFVFNEEPNEDILSKWANVISFNIFKMDGVTMCIPETDKPAMIMNWNTNQMERFDGIEDEKGLW